MFNEYNSSLFQINDIAATKRNLSQKQNDIMGNINKLRNVHIA